MDAICGASVWEEVAGDEMKAAANGKTSEGKGNTMRQLSTAFYVTV